MRCLAFVAQSCSRLRPDAGMSIGKYGGDDHFPAVRVLVSQLDISSKSLPVVMRVDQVESHSRLPPVRKSPGRGDAQPRLLGREDRIQRPKTSGIA